MPWYIVVIWCHVSLSWLVITSQPLVVTACNHVAWCVIMCQLWVIVTCNYVSWCVVTWHWVNLLLSITVTVTCHCPSSQVILRVIMCHDLLLSITANHYHMLSGVIIFSITSWYQVSWCVIACHCVITVVHHISLHVINHYCGLLSCIITCGHVLTSIIMKCCHGLSCVLICVIMCCHPSSWVVTVCHHVSWLTVIHCHESPSRYHM